MTRSRGAAFDAPSRAAVEDENRLLKARNEHTPPTVDAEEAIGGSRPGVPSRMREAVETRMEREND